jgi:drug/metabolite transporter (DMT)-like permease
MSLEVAAIVLFAALLHAGWNALIKVKGDRLVVMAAVTLAGSVFSFAFLPFVESPDPASWPLLALTILLHTGYHLFLPLAYEHGDLGQVYPIARGSAPLLVAVGAFVVAGEVLGPVTLAGVLCLAAGVISLAFDRKAGFSTNPKVIFYALMTTACIASYTVVDGVGVRTSGSILGFAVWLTVGDGLLTAILVFGWKGRAAWRVARQNLGTAFLGGAMQVGAYWIIVWALALAPMAMVSALRETSVLFAAVISAFLLKEGFGVWRFVSASLVTLGLILSRSEK